MKKYELIETGNTAIIDIEDGDPVFLNESASLIIKKHIEQLNVTEIKELVKSEFKIPRQEEDVLEIEIMELIQQFDQLVSERKETDE